MIEKTYTVRCSTELQLYDNFLNTINWMIEPTLTNAEIKVLAFIMYYNAKYSEITDKQKRFKFIFSSSTKKEMREEFDLSASKLETYLNKLRAKGVLTSDNVLEEVFCLDLSKGILLSFHFNYSDKLFPKTQKEEKPIEQIIAPVQVEEATEEEEKLPEYVVIKGPKDKGLERALKILQDVQSAS